VSDDPFAAEIEARRDGETGAPVDLDDTDSAGTTDVDEIDWRDLWEEFDFPAALTVSWTQAKLLLEASTQTPSALGNATSATVLAEAVETGAVVAADDVNGHIVAVELSTEVLES
jgi:hypothetical protein